ncbi:MAG: 4-alpha-glucanotransferase [Candidatus Symbiothrix sp.]|jgi:4-alpha-glucanotransferase|nr:4-alpha-glucanotransferase [Candidatus Symbiothrix sp.]
MTIYFKTRQQTQWGETVYISGSTPELGEWDINRALPLSCPNYPEWQIEIDIPDIREIVEYKYFVTNDTQGDSRLRVNDTHKETRGNVRWEEGENHRLKEAGIAIPIFSLRTKNSFGIGDFSDLKQLIDWAKLTGMTVIQTLPINDTTRTHTRADSYPYNAISIYALHPLYLDLNAMGRLKDPSRRAFYKTKQAELNALPTLDYEAVDHYKWAFFKELYAQEGEKVLKSKPFAAFFAANKTWLLPYAETITNHQSPQSLTINHLPLTINHLFYLQFHADKQMRAAKDYARANGIILKGDIPIGISRDSVEALTDPQLFNLDFQAGAPPDAFATDGQNWGFPTYNWEAMAADDYQWWKNRFRKMADYFDAYRIDHILGFFRIWQIPVPGTSGINGFFSPALPFTAEEIKDYPQELFIADRTCQCGLDPQSPDNQTTIIRGSGIKRGVTAWFHPRITATELGDLHWDYFYRRHTEFWKQEGLKHLRPLVESTSMLACGEDLGMIPACVPEVMRQLRILSLEIERMPKSPGYEFTDLHALPYLSVCSTSTHDMSTLRGWWLEDSEKTQRYYNHVLKQDGLAPGELTPELAEMILRNHLEAPSRLTILPFQDWLAIDKDRRNPDIEAERINIPSDPNHYWRYRMHLNIEDLLAADELNRNIQELICG